MNKGLIYKYIEPLFRNPSGLAGWISSLLMNYSNRKLYKLVLEIVKRDNDGLILEIGFGNGILIKHLADTQSETVYGVDPSDDMISIAQAKNKLHIQNGKVVLKLGSVSELPFSDNAFKTIYTINTIYFWEELNAALQEVNRVLQHDGLFVNAFFSSKRFEGSFSSQLHFKQYPIDFLLNQYRNSGLEIVEMINREEDSIICIVSKKMLSQTK